MERQKRFSAEPGKVHLAQVYYDVAKDGGAVGTLYLPGTFPNEMVTFGSRTTCIVPFASAGGTATVQMHFWDGETATQISPLLTMANLNARVNVANTSFEFTTRYIFPAPTAAYPPPRDLAIRVTIGTQPVTAGRLLLSFQYCMALSEAVDE